MQSIFSLDAKSKMLRQIKVMSLRDKLRSLKVFSLGQAAYDRALKSESGIRRALC